MNWLQKVLSGKKPPDASQDIMVIAQRRDPLIDKTALEICMTPKDVLVHRPVDSIVPGVWGARKDGELDDTQRYIFEKVLIVENEIIECFDYKNTSKPQDFARAYLMKGLFIAKRTYMLELLKNMAPDTGAGCNQHTQGAAVARVPPC